MEYWKPFVFKIGAPSNISLKKIRENSFELLIFGTLIYIQDKWQARQNEIDLPNFVLFYLAESSFPAFLESWEHFVLRIGAPSELLLKRLQKAALKFSFWPTPMLVVSGNEFGRANFVSLNLAKRSFHFWNTECILCSK